jgi:RND family efflux transporter MFP subunit
MSKKRILSIIVAVVVVVLVIIGVTCKLCGRKAAQEEKARISGVKVETIAPADVNEYFETAGTLKAQSVSEVASRVMGTVTSLKVKQGDAVKAGDVLLELDSKDLVERYKAAQAGYDEAYRSLESAKEKRSLAQTTYTRYKSLAAQNAVAQQQVDEIESQKKVADSEFERASAAAVRASSNLEEAKVTLGYAKVTAPTDGVVTRRNIEVGSMARPGEPLITVEDVSQFRVDINIDERLAGLVKVDMPIDVEIDGIGAGIKGRASEVVPSVDPASRTFLVKVAVPSQERLCTGLHSRVKILTGTRKTLLVPASAVVKKGQLTGVYVVGADKTISYRLVRTGKHYGDKVEVLSGLDAGEMMITEGLDKAVDGGILVEGK